MTNHKKQKLAILATLVVVFVSFISVSFAIIFSRPDANCVYVKVVSNGVDATFGAEFKACDGKAVVKYFDEDKRNSILQFEESEGSTQKSFSSANGTFLSEKCPYVMFRYYVTNNAKYNGSRAGKGVKVTLTDNAFNRNVSIKYRVTSLYLEDLIFDGEDANLYSDTPRVSYVAPGETIYYYVLVEKQGEKADYFGKKGDNLTWTLEKSDSYEEDGWVVDKNNVVTAYVGEDDYCVVPWTANSIKAGALEGNTTITTVVVPITITSIGDDAFKDCINLKEVNFESGYSSITLNHPDTTTDLGKNLFMGCTSLEIINLPTNATTIKQSTFEGCNALTEIAISEGITNVESHAFKDCESLISITFPSTISSLTDNIFYGCVQLEKVTFDSINYHINMAIFDGCDSIDEICYIKSGVTYGFTKDYDTTQIDAVELEDVLDGQFAGNVYLKSIVLPKTITSLPEGAFENCINLEHVVFNGDVETISDRVFKNCTSLSCVEFEKAEKLTSIGAEAFAGSGIEYFNFENEEVVVSGNAFYNCNNLTSISIQMLEQESIESGALVANVDRALFDNCSNLDRIKINILFGTEEKDRGYYTFSGGYNCIDLTYTFDFLVNPYFAYSWHIVEAVIPTYYTLPEYELNVDAFRYCCMLEKVVLPYKITKVGAAAFHSCYGLKSVEFSEFTEMIQTHTFYDCTSLEEIELPNSLTQIKACAFAGCTSLTELILPSAVIRIDELAFSGCTALEYVEMPAHIEYLAENIFDGCNNIVTIKYVDDNELGE